MPRSFNLSTSLSLSFKILFAPNLYKKCQSTEGGDGAVPALPGLGPEAHGGPLPGGAVPHPAQHGQLLGGLPTRHQASYVKREERPSL